MRVMVLSHKNHYVGSCRLLDTNHPLPVTIKKLISVVYIVPKYRRLRMAGKMLNYITKMHNCYLFVKSNNKKAINLYKKSGFIEISTNNDPNILMIST